MSIEDLTSNNVKVGVSIDVYRAANKQQRQGGRLYCCL